METTTKAVTAPTDTQSSGRLVANPKSDFAHMGMTAAETILKAEKTAEGVMLTVVMEAAMELSENPQASADWLIGLRDGLIAGGKPKGTAANRKSDCQAIFSAYHIDHEAVEKMTGGYNDTVKACRELVAKATNKVQKARNTGVKAISPKEKDKIVQRLINADNTGSSALEIMTAAQSSFIKAAGTPASLVRLVDRLAVELQRTDADNGYWKALGERLSKLTQTAIEHAEKVQAQKDAQAEKQAALLKEAGEGKPAGGAASAAIKKARLSAKQKQEPVVEQEQVAAQG